MISELYKIWRVYRDDGRLSRELEVIFIVVGGCLSQLEVVCNKGRYRAARAAKNNWLNRKLVLAWDAGD